MLNVDGAIDTAPEMSIIVPFEDVFPPIAEISVAQQKPQTAKFQIFLMVAGDRIGHEGEPDFVVPAMPASGRVIRADRNTLIDFGIRKRFVAALVPTEPAESAEIRG